ncbi:MAG: hypothetical protein RMY34_29495 [Aulosira sp. DedQUE10]|nr:hypothetical protein [Aulosira sp. DedQUE10]
MSASQFCKVSVIKEDKTHIPQVRSENAVFLKMTPHSAVSLKILVFSINPLWQGFQILNLYSALCDRNMVVKELLSHYQLLIYA